MSTEDREGGNTSLDALTDAERWLLLREKWVTYCQKGASAFDWDYDSRDLMEELTGQSAFEWMRRG